MKKSNPLFVDSTKLHGDNIVTRIELRGLSPYEGERVFVEILDHKGHYQRNELKELEGDGLGVRLPLKHQQKIRYQFVVMNEGQVVVASGALEARASHVLSETWSPSTEKYKSLKPAGYSEDNRRTPLVSGPSESRNQRSGRRRQSGLLSGQMMRSLVDKWGL